MKTKSRVRALKNLQVNHLQTAIKIPTLDNGSFQRFENHRLKKYTSFTKQVFFYLSVN